MHLSSDGPDVECNVSIKNPFFVARLGATMYYIFSKIEGAWSARMLLISMAIGRICGCADIELRRYIKLSHDLKFVVITISVFKQVGRTDLAICGEHPALSMAK